MKVLVAGLGSIGQRHVRNLRLLLGAEVEIIAFRERGLPHVITEANGIDAGADVVSKYALRVCHDLHTALAHKPDIVFVCNPTSAHMAVALAAARAGCHLFIEKPLSDRNDFIDELISLVERKHLIAAVGYQFRFHPAVRRVREWLSRRLIGQVVSVRAEVGEFLPGAHPYEDYRVSYAGRTALGGGVILSQSHELDYLQWLFGPPRRVFAVGGQMSGLDIDVEDTAGILMDCRVAGHQVPVHVLLDFVRRPPARSLHIVGSRGRIALEFDAGLLQCFDLSGTLAQCFSFADLPRNQLFVDELAHFLACVRGEALPAVPLTEAATCLRTALAARESLRSGQAQDLS